MHRMENTCLNGHRNDVSFNSMTNDIKIEEDDGSKYSECRPKRQVSRVYPVHTMALNVMKSQTSEKFIKQLFCHSTRRSNNRIPKHIVSLDERYLRHCLKMIHISAAKSATCNIYFNLSPLRMGTLPGCNASSELQNRDILDSARFFIECPLPAGSEDAVLGPSGQLILSSINGNKSMINISKSPLFQQLGASDNDINFGRTVLGGTKTSFNSCHLGSPGGLSIYSPQKLEKEQLFSDQYESDFVHDRLRSISNLNCTSSSKTASAAATVSHGMLECTWYGGFPHFVFSVDDKKEIYVSEIIRSESADDKGQFWTYLFHLKTGNLKEPEIYGNLSRPVGKMEVSTSFKHCSNNSRVMESEFVLFGDNGNPEADMQTSNLSLGQNKFSKKVSNIFRPSHSSKRRMNSKNWGTSSSLDCCPWEPSHDTNKTLDAEDRVSVLENNIPPNFELAAIVIREHLPVRHQEAEIGGWGLNFLKKSGLKHKNISQESTGLSEHCPNSLEECCTSTDILVPAGYHGGPKIRHNGPSTLIKRWRSGGQCDCGGWDTGCPLTVLNVRPSKDEVLPQREKKEEFKSYDLFTQGTRSHAPTLKIVNIRSGLHYIHFDSTLSALQCFAIAVAIIHNRSPILRPTDV